MKKYDVIVIGAGSAGLGNSGVANALGLKTVLIEKDENHFGGDCTNFGCVPSKAMIHIANHFHEARKAAKFGMTVSGNADMSKVLSYIHEKQTEIRNEEDAEALRNQGYEVIIGKARFVDKNVVEVNGEKLEAKIILLCTGSSPRMIEIEGQDNTTIYNNETLFFECKSLPEHFTVIGGGPIGCEMGQAFSRLGSKVTIVNRGERLLSKEQEKVSAILEECFAKEGIQVINNATVKSFSDGKATIESKDGSLRTIYSSAALMAIGRVVNTQDIGLSEAGIELTKNSKIKVDKYLRTSNRQVYAIGDAAGSYMLSHGAEKMVRMLWRNLLIPIMKHKNTTRDLSWVTFTDPQVAHFGWTERELDENKVNYYRQDQSFAEDDRAIIQEYQYGHTSMWMENNRNVRGRKLISGSMIAPDAGELIQEMELAKDAGVKIKTIESRVYPYPVKSRINQKTIRGVIAANRADWKKKLARLAFRLFH
ncbi:dihydrolipoyl dehydrogenase family protein [Portibacter marinus]|uniref:dihydrolipoyl dehydrogenase family protein n=1 Tax=Portibacter marinus TaxID=2898660 RepID=UPI001F455822|nr:FAD-dependent oxidoreductase [Portibacter marinus]